MSKTLLLEYVWILHFLIFFFLFFTAVTNKIKMRAYSDAISMLRRDTCSSAPSPASLCPSPPYLVLPPRKGPLARRLDLSGLHSSTRPQILALRCSAN